MHRIVTVPSLLFSVRVPPEHGSVTAGFSSSHSPILSLQLPCSSVADPDHALSWLELHSQCDGWTDSRSFTGSPERRASPLSLLIVWIHGAKLFEIGGEAFLQ